MALSLDANALGILHKDQFCFFCCMIWSFIHATPLYSIILPILVQVCIVCDVFVHSYLSVHKMDEFIPPTINERVKEYFDFRPDDMNLMSWNEVWKC